jgi:hypothetical protein
MTPVEIARVVADIDTLRGVLSNVAEKPGESWSVNEWGSNTSVHFTGGPNDTVVITVQGVSEE